MAWLCAKARGDVVGFAVDLERAIQPQIAALAEHEAARSRPFGPAAG